jgi:hypothetical protein
VPWIGRANHIDPSFAADDLAFLTNPLDAGTNFHERAVRRSLCYGKTCCAKCRVERNAGPGATLGLAIRWMLVVFPLADSFDRPRGRPLHSIGPVGRSHPDIVNRPVRAHLRPYPKRSAAKLAKESQDYMQITKPPTSKPLDEFVEIAERAASGQSSDRFPVPATDVG